VTTPADRVLVVMAKAPRPGRVKTRLAASYPVERIVDLYRCLLGDTLALACALPHTTVAVMVPPDDVDDLRPLLPDGVALATQSGTGLAAALGSVFRTFTADGPRRVLAFDSDSPHLPAALLEEAFDALATADVVLGPTDDGGYYVVGAREAHEGLFDPGPMGTDTALASVIANAERLGLSWVTTTQGFDVDVADDLSRLAALLQVRPERAPRTAACLRAWLAAPVTGTEG